MDSSNQHDHFVWAGQWQYFLEHWCLVCEWQLVCAGGEQLRTECGAHVGVEQEHAYAIGHDGSAVKLVWWRSVHLFGYSGEWRHELCVDGANGLHDSHQQRQFDCVERAQHLYDRNVERSRLQRMRRQCASQRIAHTLAGNTGEHHGSGHSMS